MQSTNQPKPLSELINSLDGFLSPADNVIDTASNILKEISPNDEMYQATRPDHYFKVGQSALRNILLALAAADIPVSKVADILDLPCGHGRVMRWIKSAFPAAAITGCDLLKDGVDYCAANFGAEPVYSEIDPSKVSLSKKYDLIWCGSLVTHLDAKKWGLFLEFFAQRLKPGGIVVFSVHGRKSRDMIKGGYEYGLTSKAAKSLMRSYQRTGFAYEDYPGQKGYGITLTALPWTYAQIEKQPDLRLLMYSETAWDNHHDIVACQKLR